jgi:RNA polymerase sigma-70 factor (ECF subfamily)
MTRELSAALPELLPRLWVFALRLCEDPCAAHHLVEHACARRLQASHRAHTGISALCEFYSAIYATWTGSSCWHTSGCGANGQRCDDLDGQADISCAGVTKADYIVKAVSALPHAERVVMLLVAVEELTVDETALILGIAARAVLSRLYRGRLKIGRRLADDESAAASRLGGSPPGKLTY